MADLTFFAELMQKRYESTLVRCYVGDEPLTCKRCNATAIPYCVELDTTNQPHARAAYCSCCMDEYGATHIKFLPKTAGERHRRNLSAGTRWSIMQRDNWTCAYCGRHRDQLPFGEYMQVDHIVPVAAGGTDDEANLTTCCCECNQGKSAKPLEV